MMGIIEIFIFVCIVCYFFNKARATDMVDIIQNRMQEAWRNPFNPSNEDGQQNTAFGAFADNGIVRRLGDSYRRRKQAAREGERKQREKDLYQIKEQAAPVVNPPNRAIHGLSCKYCSPDKSEIQLDPLARRREVKNMLRVTQHAGPQPNSTAWDWGVWFDHLAQCLRLRKFAYPQVAGTVMAEERVVNAIEQTTKQSVDQRRKSGVDAGFDEDQYYDEMHRKHERRAMHLLLEMRSKISQKFLQLTSYVLFKLLPLFLTGVATHPAQVEMLKAATEKMPGIPLVFLPLHRSHLDYILVSYILVNNDIRSPLVAGGINLNIPVFGAALRYCGAFFIKRKIDPEDGNKDLIYRAILHTYMQKCLAAEHNIEFFIEGQRTRTGKPLIPKSGILSVIVDAYLDGTVPDALLVPVSINYEKLIDGNFIREQLGEKKVPESFGSAVAGIWKTLTANYGLMRIDFNEPFSLCELVKSFNKSSMIPKMNGAHKQLQHTNSTSSLYGTDVVQEEQRVLIDSIARHVVFDCANATAVMSTNALAFLLLNRFRDGAKMSVLCSALDELRYLIEGHRDIGFTGPAENVILHAAKILGPGLVQMEKRGYEMFIKPVTMMPNVIELAYYSNSVLTYFALDSILVTTATRLAKENEDRQLKDVGIRARDLFDACLEHCKVMRYEFLLCKPCQDIEVMMQDSLDKMCLEELLSVPMEEISADAERARRLAAHIEADYSSDEDLVVDNSPRVYLPTNSHCERLVIMSALAPFAHTYLAVAHTLRQLLHGEAKVESEFIKLCIKEIRGRVDSGQCKYGEAVSTDSVRNCLKIMQKQSLIDLTNSHGVKLVGLNPAHDSIEGVVNIINKFEKYVPF